MTSGLSQFITATVMPSRTTGDLPAGMWQLLKSMGGAPKVLVWDNESGIGQKRRLTGGAHAFAGTLGLRILRVRPRDPEAKGIAERPNGYFETFPPRRRFTSPTDSNTQLVDWLSWANTVWSPDPGPPHRSDRNRSGRGARSGTGGSGDRAAAQGSAAPRRRSRRRHHRRADDQPPRQSRRSPASEMRLLPHQITTQNKHD